ncbi:hypothetical protein N657DRAFT_310895 [Parathielavia appendiculata]|uniref:Uncharacterized protein n=1 Tax=Parathielavia appendiculata TaxID=2587402 RepID=A0AAN6U5T8_9PEZI|nr:hypothetical protein N657DRAFT_310895 [Parathielavia appendiculata]
MAGKKRSVIDWVEEAIVLGLLLATSHCISGAVLIEIATVPAVPRVAEDDRRVSFPHKGEGIVELQPSVEGFLGSSEIPHECKGGFEMHQKWQLDQIILNLTIRVSPCCRCASGQSLGSELVSYHR